ncbi:8276_t:CDS:2, partial [Ambispora leptoticha]
MAEKTVEAYLTMKLIKKRIWIKRSKRRTKSGKVVPDYYELTSDSSDEEATEQKEEQKVGSSFVKQKIAILAKVGSPFIFANIGFL